MAVIADDDSDVSDITSLGLALGIEVVLVAAPGLVAAKAGESGANCA